ncbi:MAG: Ku protein [Thermoanaerobaculia bacterium]|nr:Ku protein [Thermoanaerobaculia bacterium]
MPPRPVASGTISFGLVAIPVKLYSTGGAQKPVSFNMVHKSCGSRVKYRYYCPTDDELVERDELTKGYEFARGQFVLFSDEELKALEPEPTNAVEISEFVPLDKVDPIYFEKSYYLGPDKGGAKPYRLLAQTMLDSGRAALGRYAARGKDYLVLLRPFENGLIMQQLRYADEIRAFSEVPIDEAEVKPPELELAKQLVEQTASEEFHPEKYEDEVRQRVWELVEKKVQGEEIVAAPQEEPKAQIIDLMEALKKSLGEAPGKPTQRKPAKRSARQPAAKKKGAAKKASGK